MWKPEIEGEPVKNINQLERVIEREYSCLKKYESFDQLFLQAKCHLKLYQKLQNRESIQHGEISRLAKELGMKRSLVSVFIKKAGRPRLYLYIQRCIPKKRMAIVLRNIRIGNDGIQSVKSLTRRLESYYFFCEIAKRKKYLHHLTQCRKYFTALEELRDGGCYKAVAKTIEVDQSRIIWWARGQKPYLLKLVGHIPKKPPKKGCMWLPRKMITNFQPSNFIEIPRQITKWAQILKVIQKLKPLRSGIQSHKRVDSIDTKSAFGYILGIMISDASKHKDCQSSMRIALGLSKNYSWSKQVGTATCHYLRLIGIQAKRGKDSSSNKGDKNRYFWYSERSPIIKWINQTCLGLTTSENTTSHAVRAEWLIEAPNSVQIKFIQGLSDGDGYASIKGKALGIACPPNTSLIKRILARLNIRSKVYPDKIVIKRNDSIIKATRLPLFLHAKGRQKKAEKLLKMITLRKNTRNKFDSEIKKQIKEWAMKGLSSGTIQERFYDEKGISLSRSQIFYYIKRFQEQGLKDSV